MNQLTVAQQRDQKVMQFKKNFKDLIDRKELALPSTVSVDAFRNAAIVAVQNNPDILNCDQGSVFRAIRNLAAAGLIPDNREAAIVPFKGQAQAMPMVYGIIKVARNSGGVKSLWADVVYEGEIMTVDIQDGERVWKHTRADGSPIDAMSRGGAVVGAFAVAKLSDGTIDFQPMSRAEIEKRRMASANQRDANKPSGIWESWYEEMAKKTVIRNLAKRLPMSSEDMNRLMAEDDANRVELARDVTPEMTPLQRKVAAAKAAQEAQDQDQATDTPEDRTDAAEDAEIVPSDDDEAPHWTETLDTAEAFPGSDEFTEGVKARQAGMKPQMCPHDEGTQQAIDWLGGYDQAANAVETGDEGGKE